MVSMRADWSLVRPRSFLNWSSFHQREGRGRGAAAGRAEGLGGWAPAIRAVATPAEATINPRTRGSSRRPVDSIIGKPLMKGCLQGNTAPWLDVFSEKRRPCYGFHQVLSQSL